MSSGVFALVGQDLSLGGLLVLIVVAIALKAVLMLLAMAQVGYAAAHVAMTCGSRSSVLC